MGHPFFDVPTPCAIGHRGAAGELPENTLSSLERARARGAAILETDLRLSADGVPVLFHDANLDRTTDGQGPLASRPYAALRRLDAAFHFRPPEGEARRGPPPLRGRGVRIPSFEEALATFANARFNVELKDPDPALTRAALACVADAGCAHRVLLTAEGTEHMSALREAVAEADLDVAIGACIGDVIAFLGSVASGAAPPGVASGGRSLGPMALQVPPRTPHGPLVDAAFVDHAHAHGLVVHVWTINDPAEMDTLLGLGVDGIVSDFPGRVIEAIGRATGTA